MNLTLSWDLFIIVFFAIVVTYTFIIGKKESVKMIVATYIAIVAVQGIGNLLQRLTNDTGGTMLNFLGMPTMSLPVLSIIKLVLFITIVILLTVKAGINVEYNRENSIVSIAVTALSGVATAGLLLSALLTYVSNVPLLDMTMPEVSSLSPILQQSSLMQIMILNQDLWFSLPAVMLIVAGYVSNE